MLKGKNGTNFAINKKQVLSLIKVLRQINYTRTEELLIEEANINSDELDDVNDDTVQSIINAITSSEDPESHKLTHTQNGTTATPIRNPELYSQVFENLKIFVDESLDIYKHELSTVLFPILVQIYVKLVRGGCLEAALKFVHKYASCLESYYKEDIQRLLLIRKPRDIDSNDFVQCMETDKFVIKMCRDAYSLLKRHLQDRKQDEIADIVAKYLQFDTYEGSARSKKQCDASAGSLIGEARRQDNKLRVYYGLFKEVDFQSLVPQTPVAAEEDDDDIDAPDKPKKKKSKKDPLFSKKSKSDPNAPAIDRIPLPELKDSDKIEKLKALRESTKRVNLNKDTLPSVCLFTLLNSQNLVCCVEISEDATLLAVGLATSNIHVWSLIPDKLRKMKGAEQLKDIDKDSEDIHIRMMDENSGETMKILIGHMGAVNRCSFSPDKLLLLSCSEDTTIRLWSMQLWECLVVYKGHLHPVWDVRFSPHGYYFVSGSYDKTARLWTTDNSQPIRIFAGHLADVDCVQFHPNSNYVATGSSDRTVRLYDVLNGQMVRLMTGHKRSIYSLLFSTCGRYLISGSSDCTVNVWDISNGQLVASLIKHTDAIQSLAFSREGSVLAVGGSDYQLSLWDFSKLTEEYISRGGSNVSHNIEQIKSEDILLRVFASKQTPLLGLLFTRRNYLLAAGPFKN